MAEVLRVSWHARGCGEGGDADTRQRTHQKAVDIFSARDSAGGVGHGAGIAAEDARDSARVCSLLAMETCEELGGESGGAASVHSSREHSLACIVMHPHGAPDSEARVEVVPAAMARIRTMETNQVKGRFLSFFLHVFLCGKRRWEKRGKKEGCGQECPTIARRGEDEAAAGPNPSNACPRYLPPLRVIRPRSSRPAIPDSKCRVSCWLPDAAAAKTRRTPLPATWRSKDPALCRVRSPISMDGRSGTRLAALGMCVRPWWSSRSSAFASCADATEPRSRSRPCSTLGCSWNTRITAPRCSTRSSMATRLWAIGRSSCSSVPTSPTRCCLRHGSSRRTATPWTSTSAARRALRKKAIMDRS